MQGKEMRTVMRSVLTKGTGNLTNGSSVIQQGVTSALGRVADGSATTELAMIGVGLTLEGLRLGYESIEAHAQAGREAYDLFVQDYNTKTVSFFLPNNESGRNGRQRIFNEFIKLFQESDKGRNSPLFRYAGINYTENVEVSVPNTIMGSTKTIGTRYSLISMSALVFAGPGEYGRSGDPILDIALQGSDMFLQDRLPLGLAEIFSYKSNNPLDYGISGHLRPEILQRLDLVRFMMLVYANLLTNIQHPTDLSADTDMPLSAEEALELCAKVLVRINTILSPNPEHTQWDYLKKLYCKPMFDDFLRLVKREVEELQEGYQSKVLNQLDLNGLIAQSHGILQTSNAMWHRIFYLGKHHTKPLQLLYLIRSLSNALDDHPDFWQTFLSKKDSKNQPFWPVIAGLNQPYCTVFDLVGLFSSLVKNQKEQMLATMQELDIPRVICDTLHQLDQFFIQPLEADLLALKENAGHAFLMNLIAISTESRTPFLQEAIVPVAGRPTLQQQVATLNNAQIVGSHTPAFTWRFLDSLDESIKTGASRTLTKQRKKSLASQTVTELRLLLKAEYEFLDIVRSLGAFQDLLESNRNILLRKNVRNMLKKVLSSLSQREAKFTTTLQALVAQLNTHDKIDGQEKTADSNQRREYILEMVNDNKGLKYRLRFVKSEIERAITVLDSSEFSKKIEQELIGNVEAVAFTSHAEFTQEREQLFAALQLPGPHNSSQSFHETDSVVNSSVDHRDTTTMVLNTHPVLSEHESDDGVAIDQQNLPEGTQQGFVSTQNTVLPSPDSDLRLQLILQILRAISLFLLVTGLLMLVSLTFGAPYLPLIVSLNAQQLTIGTIGTIIGGGVSTVVGGAGLVLSYFFKPTVVPEVQNGSDHVEEMHRAVVAV